MNDIPNASDNHFQKTKTKHESNKNAMDIDHMDNNEKLQLFCQICEIYFDSLQSKMEHMNNKQHLINVQFKLNESNNLFQKQQEMKLKPKLEEPQSDCCLLSHRDYFNIDAYHSKIIERSLQTTTELKYMKLKHNNFKTEIKKSNQMLKALKQEFDKKQSILNDLTKSSNGLTEKLNMFKNFIQMANSNDTLNTNMNEQIATNSPNMIAQDQIIYVTKPAVQQQSQQINQNSVVFINQNDSNNIYQQQQQQQQQIQQQQQFQPQQQQQIYTQQQFQPQQQHQQIQFINYINPQQQQPQMMMMQPQQQQQSSIYLNDQFNSNNYVLSSNQLQQQL